MLKLREEDNGWWTNGDPLQGLGRFVYLLINTTAVLPSICLNPLSAHEN
jgi:hypothetical protein